jgi:hypothetical protein
MVYPSTVNPGVVNNSLPGTVTTGYPPNNAPITIVNPSEYSTPLSFNLNGQVVRLEPGQSTEIAFDRSYVIEFHRGGDYGTTRYSLRDGRFEFFVSDSGWDLKRVRAEPPANPVPNSPAQPPANPSPGQPSGG